MSHDDNLRRATDLVAPSYTQKRAAKTTTQVEGELQQAQALALIEIAYSLRRIEGLLRR